MAVLLITPSWMNNLDFDGHILGLYYCSCLAFLWSKQWRLD